MVIKAVNYKLLNDDELVKLIREKDYSAFEEIVERYSPKAMRLALKITKSKEDAQDVVQDTFVSVYKNIDSFRGDSLFSSWIYRICTNFALMKLRGRRYDNQSESIDENPNMDIDKLAEHSHQENDWSDRIDKLLLRKELRQKIDEAIDKLPDEYRVVFIMKDIEGMSNEEIGKELNLSVPAVKSRLHRARLFLRKEISKYINE
ncbi:MAG: RNA polymerase sigma-70 factor [Deltaproteobacteria bacterium]|nr:RNA polymerase sigma-70 factor [Deltaproteobacteria bacterium]